MRRARKEKKNLVMNSSVIQKEGHATTVANLAKKLTTVDFLSLSLKAACCADIKDLTAFIIS